MSTKPSESTRLELLDRDARYVLRPWSGLNEPVVVTEARDCFVTDAAGQSFLDFTSGYFVNNVGHSHPRVLAAARRQLEHVSQVSGRHTTIPLIDLAERLVTRTPATLEKAFFTTGGSESNEFAFKLARQHTGKRRLAVLDNAFHGLSLGALAACGSEKYRKTAGVPFDDTVYRIPTPYCYRCPHEQSCELQCLDTAQATLSEAADETAVLVAEPVQSVGGIIPPKKWWARLDQIRRDLGLLLALDEIQTGCGRTGALYACEHYGLEPDIMTTAKGLSGGVGSLGAVLVGNRVSEGFFAGTTPTSGGNAISAAAGCELLDVLQEERVIENAAAMGQYFTDAVSALADPWIGDIRFLGLLGGVELVRNRDTKEPLDKAAMARVQTALHLRGNLLTASGPHGNVLRLQPPLTVTSVHLDGFCADLRSVLSEVRAADGDTDG